MVAYKSIEDIASSGKKILVFGAGGGGDVLGAYYLYKRLKRLGADAILGSVVWERLQVDPFPGPIPLETLVNAEPLGWTIALVDTETASLRYGHTVKPQVARIAEKTGEKTVFLDLSKGAEGLREALEVAREELGTEIFVGVDTGGDILATGCEDNLWSPLADAISLYALENAPGDALLLVLSPGADGELSWTQVLERISIVARRNGLIEVLGLSRRDYEELVEVEDLVVSEASKIPLRAFRGEYETARIRGGTREVYISPCQATAYLLDARIAGETTPLPSLVAGTRGIGQASEALNEHCIVTELDLEMELNRLREHPRSEGMSIVEIRRSLVNKLIRRGCRPPECS